MSKLTAYLHPPCRTGEPARHGFRQHEMAFIEKDIRTTPPSPAELRARLAGNGRLVQRPFGPGPGGAGLGGFDEKQRAVALRKA